MPSFLPVKLDSSSGELSRAVSGSDLIPLSVGGTATDLSSTGGAGNILKQETVGSQITVATLIANDIPGTLNSTVLGNGSTATTQAALDDSTKIATTAYTDSAVSAALSSSIPSFTNGNSGTIAIGQVLYCSSAGFVNMAKADSASTCEVIGLAISSSLTGTPVNVCLDGQKIDFGTTANADSVFGTTGGLTFNTKYFLSASTAGMGTATSPNATGNKVKQVLIGLSPTIGIVQIGPTYTA